MSASTRPSRHRLRSRLFLCLALFGAGIAAANGGTITVTSTADDGSPGTLRDALVHAVDGDVIELPAGAVFQMGTVFDDAANFMGPTATPMITAGIIIEANGSRLERRADSPSFRAFAVGPSGSLTIRNAHIKGFAAQGGRGGDEGGGGGMGAGGAIFVHGGALTVESSTFEGNTASGGAGGRFSGFSSGGGGGGLSGRGGGGSRGGGGGGGSRGDGGHGNVNPAGGGGGGGGTLGFFGSGAESNSIYGGVGGHDCGGQGGDYPDVTGADAPCPGGGGGGGSTMTRGGAGSYGGGGGGGPYAFADGGAGGFGGGGGAGGRSGGDGGFGGGGGAGFSTGGGRDAAGFGGAGGELSGGGGAGLGGAIFNDGGAVTIVNTTLTANAVAGGPGGSTTQQTNGSLGNSGAGAGGAIFSRNGSLTVLNATIAGNATSQTAGGIFVQADGAATSFTLRNTIIANNAADECLLAGNAIHDGSGNLIVQNYDCPGVVSVTDPQLGSLQSNPPGGTPTLAIGAGSSALDAGDDDSCRPTDQRGVARPQSAHCDIGAFEASQPVARCQDRTVSADAACMADASVDDGSYDPAGIPVTMSQDPPGPYPRGATSVTLTATNGFGAHSSCTATVTVIDTTPPVVTVKPTINVLLNNHTYKRFTVLDLVESVQDNCSPLTVVDSVISRVTSDEPDDARGSGDGSTTNDIWIAPSCKWVALQQERDGGKDGRVYVSTIGVKDADGNIGTARSIVAVPLSSNQMPAVDSGIAFAVDGCSP